MKVIPNIAGAVSLSLMMVAAGLARDEVPEAVREAGRPDADQAAPKPLKDGLIEIDSKFFEIPEDEARRLGLVPGFAADGAPAKKAEKDEAGATAVDAILNPGATESLLRKIKEAKGVNLLSAPRVTTRSGQRAVIEIIREFRYPTEFEFDPGAKVITPKAFETRNIGVTLEVEPKVRIDGPIELELVPQVVRLEGYMRASDGQPVPLLNGRSVGADMTLKDFAAVKFPSDTVLQPVFSTHKLTTSVSLFSDNTVVLGGMRKDKHENGKERVSNLIYVLITVRRLDARPGGLAVLPVAFINKADEDGFVRSPYAPEQKPIDARGLPPGTELKCPTTKQLFRLP